MVDALHIFLDFLVVPASFTGLYAWAVWQTRAGAFDALLGEVAREIVRAFHESPDKWRHFDRYTVDFSRTPVEYSHQAPARLWVANGPGFVKLNGEITSDFSWLERQRIWRAYTDWRRGAHHPCSPAAALFRPAEGDARA